MSLRRILMENTPIHQTLLLSGKFNFSNKNRKISKNYSLICGHFPLEFFGKKKEHNIFISCLREPISRAISSFYYAKHKKNNYLHKKIAQFKGKPINFFQNFSSWEFENPYCRNFCNPEHQRDTQINKTHYHQALNNLSQKLDFIAITEKFTKSIFLLKELFDFKISKIPYENITKKKPKKIKSKELINILSKKNHWDIKLYQKQKKIFEKYFENKATKQKIKTF